jgi:hypothetical protein
MKPVLFPLITVLAFGAAAAAQPPQPAAQGGGRGGAVRGPGPLGGFARDQQAAPTGTAVIRGRIVAVDTGAPIRRAQVRATSGGGRGRLTTTDAEGRFEFKDLPAGRWDISASKAGFVTLRYGQRRPFEAGRPIELADKQVMDRADVSLPRGAAITGHVFDEFGDPIAGARVVVMRYQVVQGIRRLTPTGGGDQSDDTGAFRVFGLMPGDYYVSATVRALPVDDPADATSYAPTYFPGTGSVTEAQKVTVGLGQEQGNVSFSLLPVRTVRVMGTVIDSSGAPLTGGVLMLSPSDQVGAGFGGPLGQNGTRIAGDGTFTIPNVAPGSYTLIATSGGPGGGAARGRFGGAGPVPDIELATVPLTVGNEDLTGITMVTGKGATVSGTIVAAQGAGTKIPTNGIQITTQSLQPQPTFARPARAEADGTFVLSNLFGSRVIRVNGLPQNWMLKAVMVAGVDVSDTPMDFKSTQDYKDAQIILTDRITEVNGKVAGEGTTAALDYTVVIFPDDPMKWTGPSRYIRSARPDQQGMFKIRSLPPTRYLAVAVDYLEEGEANDPEFLEEMKAKASTFSLADGETKSVDLKLIAR